MLVKFALLPADGISFIRSVAVRWSSLAEALQLTLALTPSNKGQQTAQREITTALENALDARRQRIIVSQSAVNWLKWLCLCLQAACALLAIAMVHSDNGLASAITMGLFGIGVAASCY